MADRILVRRCSHLYILWPLVVLKRQHFEMVNHSIKTLLLVFFLLLEMLALLLDGLVHDVVLGWGLVRLLFWLIVVSGSSYFKVRVLVFFVSTLVCGELRLRLKSQHFVFISCLWHPSVLLMGMIHLNFSSLLLLVHCQLFYPFDITDLLGLCLRSFEFVCLLRATPVFHAVNFIQIFHHLHIDALVLECEQRFVHVYNHVVFLLKILLELVPLLLQVVVRTAVAARPSLSSMFVWTAIVLQTVLVYLREDALELEQC